jgi:hypothetical protein
MISYERWLAYCCNVTEDGDPGAGFEKDRHAMEALAPVAIATYVKHFLQSLDHVAETIGTEQLAQTLWFILGVMSGYVSSLLSSGEVPLQLLVDCIRAFGDAYPTVLDRVCCAHGEDPDGRYYDRDPIDIAVYMLWDVSGLSEYGSSFMPATPISEALWEAVGRALRCRTSSCQMSGFHALGHMQRKNRDRVALVVGEALAARVLPGWLRDYALRAQDGAVQ